MVTEPVADSWRPDGPCGWKRRLGAPQGPGLAPPRPGRRGRLAPRRHHRRSPL